MIRSISIPTRLGKAIHSLTLVKERLERDINEFAPGYSYACQEQHLTLTQVNFALSSARAALDLVPKK